MLDFYVNKLGFEKRADNPIGPGMRWVTVVPPGGKAEIVLAQGFGAWLAEKVEEFSQIVLSMTDADLTRPRRRIQRAADGAALGHDPGAV